MQVTNEAPTRHSPWSVFTVTSLAVFAVLLDALVIIVAFPTITRAFHGADVSNVSWVVNAYTIVYAALLVPAGRLADLVGRKRLFIVGVGVFTVFSGLSGTAPSLDLLVSFRVVQAIGGAILSSSGLALTLAAFPAERRVMAVTLVGAIAAFAVVVGPTLGALIVEYWDWRWIFYVNLPIGTIVAVGGLWVLPESRDRTQGTRPDVPGILLMISGTAFVAYGIIQSGTQSWVNLSVTGSLLGGAVLLGLLALEIRYAKSPVVDPALFRDRSFVFANAGLFVFSIGFTGLFFNTVYFLTDVWRWSLLWTGLTMIPPALMVVALAPLAGRLAGRFGHRALVLPGGLIFALGQAMLWYRVTPTPNYVGVWLPTSILTGIGIAFVLPVLTSAFAYNLPPGKFAVGSGVGNAFRQFGTVVGASLAISYLSVRTGTFLAFGHIWFFTIASGVGASILAVGLGSIHVALPEGSRRRLEEIVRDRVRQAPNGVAPGAGGGTDEVRYGEGGAGERRAETVDESTTDAELGLAVRGPPGERALSGNEDRPEGSNARAGREVPRLGARVPPVVNRIEDRTDAAGLARVDRSREEVHVLAEVCACNDGSRAPVDQCEVVRLAEPGMGAR